MKYSALCICAFLLLIGCASNSTSYVTYYLDKGYDGHPVNEFFRDYGYPAGEFKAGQGKAYRWTSVRAPEENRAMYATADGTYQITDNYRGSTVRNYCELRIITNRDDIILGFSIAVDSTGKWSSSRCSELFTKIYP